jgi:hypothetical protein
MKNLSRIEWIVIIVFIAVKMLIHFLTNTNYDLHRDTFLYYSLSENLDWGYASVPPFIGFLTKVATTLFGYSEFALNFFPVIAGAVSIFIIALIVKELGGKIFAIVIACLSFLLSIAYLRSNSLMQPVSFDQFFWLLSAYFIVKLINTQDSRFWYMIMVAWAVGFMNKYLIAGYALSFVVALLLTKHRKLLFSKHFVYGTIIAFVIVLPNLIWQYNHNWPVVHHLSELSQTQLVNVSIIGFLIDQLMMNIQALIVWMTGLVVYLFYKSEKNFRVLSYASLLVIFLLIITHGKSYYTLGAYTLLMSMGGYAIEKYFNKAFKSVTLVLLVLLSVPAIPFSLPVLSFPDMERYSKPMAEATNRWEDGKVYPVPQDYADMTGWKELSDIVISTYISLPPEVKANTGIYAENYGQAGAVYYYGRKDSIPQPISFSDNFLIWAPDIITKDNLIYINFEIGDIKFLFKNYELKGEVKNRYFRENGVKVFFCSHPTDTFRTFYKEKAKELKSIYTRK